MFKLGSTTCASSEVNVNKNKEAGGYVKNVLVPRLFFPAPPGTSTPSLSTFVSQIGNGHDSGGPGRKSGFELIANSRLLYQASYLVPLSV